MFPIETYFEIEVPPSNKNKAGDIQKLDTLSTSGK